MTLTIKNIEDFIDAKILERGTGCLDRGAIIEIEELDENDFAALVWGTKIYTVNIRINKALELLTHECNCPYDLGPICKHKVAVILKVREKITNGVSFKEGDLTMIKKGLKNYKKVELSQLLLLLARSSIETRNQLLIQMGFEVDEEDYL